MAVIPAASAMDAAGNMGGIRPDGIYFIRDGELKFYPWDQLGGGGGTAGNGLPAGGNIGDVLVKTAAADYAAGWAPQAGLEIHSYEMTLSSDRMTLSVDIPADIFSAGKLFFFDALVTNYHVFSTVMTGDGLEDGNLFLDKDGDMYRFGGTVTEEGDNVHVSFAFRGGNSLGGSTILSKFPSGMTAIMHVLSAATATQGPQGEPGAQGPAGKGVPAGGNTGQVLSKTGNADYETAWEDAPSGSAFTDCSSTDFVSYDGVFYIDIPYSNLPSDWKVMYIDFLLKVETTVGPVTCLFHAELTPSNFTAGLWTGVLSADVNQQYVCRLNQLQMTEDSTVKAMVSVGNSLNLTDVFNISIPENTVATVIVGV